MSFRLPLSALLILGLLATACGPDDRDLHEEAAPEPAESAALESERDGDNASEDADGDGDSDDWLQNRIAWTTASEIDNFGYDIYRGDAEEGPFERITEEPIPGHGTTDEPSSYRHLDRSIEPGTVYWYYVESISLDGERERFTPIFPSKPKYAPDAAPQEPSEPESAEPAS